MKQLLLVFGCLVAFSFTQAAVPVEERSIGGNQQPANRTQQPSVYPESDSSLPAPGPIPVQSTDTYGTLQMLQQEIMELRGLVDELSHEVSQLKQRQIDDYMELDRRISASGSAGESSRLPSTSPQIAPRDDAAETPDNGNRNEVDQYSAAYNLLKDGRIDQAKSALQQHTSNFPDGQYTPNAYYWLGEIYLLENELEKAAESFEIVVNRYPAHNKAPDARFKLGKTYHLAGNGKARQVLEQAARGVGSSASLARKYLEENF